MSDPTETPPAPPKRRGRPPKVQAESQPTVVLTPEEKRRLEWERFSRDATAWEGQQPAPCPHCGAYAGYNPVTGIHIRQYLGLKRIDGHRDSCPVKEQAAVQLR